MTSIIEQRVLEDIDTAHKIIETLITSDSEFAEQWIYELQEYLNCLGSSLKVDNMKITLDRSMDLWQAIMHVIFLRELKIL